MLGICVVLAMPLLLLFKHLGWLQWWHAVLAGAVCSLPGLYLEIGDNPVRAMIYGPTVVIGFLSIGAAAGFIFWLAGLRGNAKFPGAGGRIPKTTLLLIPLAIVALTLYTALDTTSLQGRPVSIDTTSKGPVSYGTAKVRLTDGREISALILDHHRVPDLPKVCVLMTTRRSISLVGSEYWISHFLERPFEKFDVC